MRKRNLQILIRANETEFALYKKRLNKAGMSGNKFCLACLLNHPINVIENMPAILRQLKAIGNNLNQIARATNAGIAPPPVFDEIKQEVNILWQLLKQ